MKAARFVTLAAAIGAGVALTAPATADGDHGGVGGGAALAEALFSTGKSLMNAQDYGKACPMLEESQRIDPAGGTLLALALCHERQGRTATAWAEFRNAEALAVSEHEPDREAVSRDHLVKLEPRLCRLSIKVGARAADAIGLVVRRDGVVIARSVWGLDAPVDPGPHRLEATAPGKLTWSTAVLLTEPGHSVAIEVPPLEDETSPPPPALAPVRRSTLRKAGSITLAGAGVTALSFGAVFGVMAIGEQSDSNQRCPTSACTDERALEKNASARSHAVIADVMIPLGLAASAGGVILFLTAPGANTLDRRGLRLGVTATDGARAVVAGTF